MPQESSLSTDLQTTSSSTSFSSQKPLTRRAFLTSAVALTGASAALSLLSACGGGSTTTGGSVILTYGWWSNDPQKDDAMKAWTKDFEQSHPTIKVVPEILPWNNYWDKVKTTTAGGKAYDLIGIASGAGASYFANGSLMDISTFSDYQSATTQLETEPQNLFRWGNKVLGFPVGVAVPVMGFNKNLFQAAQVPFPDPATPMAFDQFKMMAKQLTKFDASGKATQYAFYPTFLGLDTLVFMEGGQVYDTPVNPSKVLLNTPEGIAGLRDLLDLHTEKIVPPPEEMSNGPWGSGGLPSLQTGKIAIADLGPWSFPEIESQSPNISIFPFFAIKEQAVTSNANGLAIYRRSQHPQEAWEFLKWATQAPAQTSFAKFSDVPSNSAVLAQLLDIVKPKEFVPAVLSDLKVFHPSVVTNNLQVSTVLNEILIDMIHGKITPAQAAAQFETKGNAALAGNS